MKILVVAQYQNDGSPTAIFIHDQMKAYICAGHEVLAIAPVAIGKKNWHGERLSLRTRKCTIDGIRHVFPRYLSLSRFGTKNFGSESAIMAIKTQFPAILEGFKPDVIHAHTLGFGSEIGAWLKEKIGCPLIVTTHGSDTFVPFNAGRQEDLKDYSNKADAVVCVSSLLGRRLIDSGVTVPVSTILNGFDVSYVSRNTSKKQNLVIQVGNLIPRKKTDISIRAIAELAKRTEDIRFTVVGSGQEKESLEKLCEALGIADLVTFTGQLPNQEVQQKMAEATFFVMPSVREGFGIVYLEAMAAGCVVIGTEGEGIADLIINGENGFLVPADDTEAVVHVIQTCMDHPQRAALIADRGRESAQKLTWKYNVEQYQSLFQKLVNEETA